MSFQKVSLEEWISFNNKDFVGSDIIPRTDEKNYNKIAKPERSTKNSAGYDFKLPFDIDIPANTPVIIPTGIIADLNSLMYKANLNDDDLNNEESTVIIPVSIMNRYLAIYPRSSLGFKYGMKLLNSVGIIDSDYAHNESNEGHIMIGFETSKPMRLEQGTKFCQGIIQTYMLMADDISDGERIGGIGSTGTK